MPVENNEYSRKAFLKKMVDKRVISKRHIFVAARELSGKKTYLGFSKFDRNVDVMRRLYDRLGKEAPSHLLKAALFYEASDRIAGNLGKATQVALAANELSRARTDPESFSKKVVDVNSVDAFLINSTALLHGLQQVMTTPVDSPLRLNPEAKHIAEIAMRVHTPLAELLGLHRLRNDLGEAALKVSDPETHQMLDASLEDAERMLKLAFNHVGNTLRTHARKSGYDFEIQRRIRKQPFSTWEKLVRKGMTAPGRSSKILDLVRDLHDVLGYRVVFHVNDLNKGRAVVRRFAESLARSQGFDTVRTHNDYLGENMKPNGFESLNLEVHRGSYSGQPHKLEVQVQTREMEHRASDAIASHALHKSASLPYNLVAAILALGREAPYKPLMRGEAITVKVHDGSQLHVVRIGRRDTLLHALAMVVPASKLADGFRVHVLKGDKSIQKPLGARLIPGSTVTFVPDTLGLKPHTDWLKWSGHQSVKEAMAMHTVNNNNR